MFAIADMDDWAHGLHPEHETHINPEIFAFRSGRGSGGIVLTKILQPEVQFRGPFFPILLCEVIVKQLHVYGESTHACY